MSLGTIDEYTLTKKLGEGFSAKVMKARKADGTEHALKIFNLEDPKFDKKAVALLQKEVGAVSHFNHSNIVLQHGFKNEAILNTIRGSQKRVAYIAQELVANGEFFDYLVQGNFDASMCRRFFKQMLQAMAHLQARGYSHRDLKPENILVDANFDLKIADFGFATAIEANTEHGMNVSRVGTYGYMAPEIMARIPYQGHVADMFSLGVILFIMYVGHPPFNMATAKDPYYTMILDNNADKFWRAHERLRPDLYFSSSFKHLLTCMLQPGPCHRLGMADIIAHRWMTEGHTASSMEAQNEMGRRLQQMQREKEAQKPSANQREEYRSVANGNVEIKPLDVDNMPRHGFFVGQDAEQTMAAIEQELRLKNNQFNLANNNAFKLQFDAVAEDNEENESEDQQPKDFSKIQIRLLKDPRDQAIFVEFQRKGGSCQLFHQMVLKYTELLTGA